MSRLRLNTRVTLGISFCPSCTSGLLTWSLSFPAVYSASRRFTRCPLSAAPPRQRQLAARNLHHHRHIILRAVQLEVIHFHCDGEVGNRIAQHQRIFQLPLLVRGRELGELLTRVVTLAIIQLGGDLL